MQQLRGTLANGQVQLAWFASEDAAQYLVLRGASGTGPFGEVGRAIEPAYLDTSSLYGETYFYRVQALGLGGPGKLSSAIKVPITASAPTELVAKVSPAGVALSWNRASGESQGYQIFTTVRGSTPTQIGATDGTSFLDPSPPAGPTTSYLVVGQNPAGPGVPAAVSIVTPPAAPQPVAAGATDSVLLSWPPVLGATSYLVSRDGTALLYVSGTYYLDTGLAILSQHSYSVRSFNEAGSGGVATVQAKTGPPAPQNVAAAAADTEAIVSWDVAPAPDGYQVLRADNPQGPFVNLSPGGLVTQGFFVDPTLTSNQVYFYQVIATQAGGLSTPVEVSVFSQGIAVRSATTYVTEQGDRTQVDDLSGANGNLISATLPSGAGVLPSLGTKGGDLVIPLVPPGGYFLRLGSASTGLRFYATSSRAIDLGRAQGGRPKLVPAQVSPTRLDLTLTGLDPWKAGDQLELFSYGANDTVFRLESAGSTAPAVGATALTTTLDLASCCFLIDSTQGDLVSVLQLVGANSDNGFVYQSLKGIAQPPGPITIADGGQAKVAGTFTQPAQQSISVNYLRSQFKSFQTAVNPAATSAPDLLGLQAAPGYAAHGNISNGADLVLLRTDSSTGDLALGSLAFAPPPPAWQQFLFVQANFLVKVMAPGATIPQLVPASISILDLPANFTLSSLGPRLSPATKPLINNTADAFMPQTKVGVTPALSWSPPALGGATSYAITLYQVSASGGQTAVALVAQLFTAATSLTVPPGLLLPGSAYLAVLSARRDTASIDLTPQLVSPSEATADLVTAVFQP